MRFRKSNPSKAEHFQGKHRFEHWYRDNTIYFITSACRDHFHAFAEDEAKAIFRDRFDYYTQRHGFVLWVTTLLSNHYHTLGYLKRGEELGQMMRKLHGSVAKLVNDTLPARHLPFWREKGHKDYFDAASAMSFNPAGHIATSLPNADVTRGVARAFELQAFLEEVPYARYERE